jgi:hypothetical protein
MKKQLTLAILLATTSVAALATEPFAGLQYKYDRLDSGASSSGYAFDVGSHLTNYATVDVYGETMDSNQSKSLTNRIEGGLALSAKVMDQVGVYARGALGNKMTQGADSMYYSIEPGVFANLTKSDLVSVGYRYRSATQDNKLDQTRAVRIGYTHSVTHDIDLNVTAERYQGDVAQTSILAGAAIKF